MATDLDMGLDGQPVTREEVCEYCGGCGERFEHTADCENDFCALAGGIDDCDGEVVVCHCIEQRDDFDCPRCGGDCSSANPSVMFCPLAPPEQSRA